MNSSRVPTGQKHQIVAAALMVLCLAASAAAQFEISPDHFDAQPTSVSTQLTPKQQAIQARISEQKRILNSYYTQIKTRSQEVESIWQDLMAHGTEAGQDLALSAQQKQLEQLRKALAAEINTAEATLADLENQERTLTAQAQVKPGPPQARVRYAGIKPRRRSAPTLRASIRAAQ